MGVEQQQVKDSLTLRVRLSRLLPHLEASSCLPSHRLWVVRLFILLDGMRHRMGEMVRHKSGFSHTNVTRRSVREQRLERVGPAPSVTG